MWCFYKGVSYILNQLLFCEMCSNTFNVQRKLIKYWETGTFSDVREEVLDDWSITFFL